jgi:hypothetical protein
MNCIGDTHHRTAVTLASSSRRAKQPLELAGHRTCLRDEGTACFYYGDALQDIESFYLAWLHLITERAAEGVSNRLRCTRLYRFTIFRALHIMMREARFLRQPVDRPTQVNTILTQCCHLLRTILKKIRLPVLYYTYFNQIAIV